MKKTHIVGLILIAIAIGTWIALYLVANKNFDYKYKDFSDDAGKVVGKLFKKGADKVKTVTSLSSQLLNLKKGNLPGGLPGISQLADLKNDSLPTGLPKLADLKNDGLSAGLTKLADLTVPGAAPSPTQ